jgi:transposase InsO family protein
MGCTTVETRKAMVKAVKLGMKVKDVARIFDVSRKTVWKWRKRVSRKGWPNYRDRSKKPHTIYSKVDPYVENAIVILRDSFQWGTQRIKVYLESPPDYIQYLLENVLGVKWSSVSLSRETINNVLKKHRRNGSPYGETKKWKYFRADYPNQLWQIDIKGPFTIEGKRMLALVIVDDNSRYLLSCTLHMSIIADDVLEILSMLVEKGYKPCKVLVDLGSQFWDIFEEGCKKLEIEVEHTPKHYPQSKGKVERCIRTFNEEFLCLGIVFDGIDNLLTEFVRWYNFGRTHMGIGCVPAALYFNGKNVTHVY